MRAPARARCRERAGYSAAWVGRPGDRTRVRGDECPGSRGPRGSGEVAPDRFDTAEHTVLSAWGAEPLLVRRGTTDIRVQFDADADATVHALDVGGARLWQVHTESQSGGLSFRAATVQAQGTCMAYEVTR